MMKALVLFLIMIGAVNDPVAASGETRSRIGGPNEAGPMSQVRPGVPPRIGSVPEPIVPAPVLPFGPHYSPLISPGELKPPAVHPPSVGNPGTGFWKR